MSEQWVKPSAEFGLGRGQVHVWRASLVRSQAERDVFWQFLSPDERARAERFHFDVHRYYFIVGRGLLRWLNGRYLSIPPRDIQFSYSHYHKPSLVNQPDLHFNVSHGQGKLLIGFAWDAEIGVDIEEIRVLDSMDDIARRYFSTAENVEYAQVAVAQKAEAFFNCWTRKEAFIKAVGEGLSYPLDVFDVSLLPGEVARIRRVKGSETEAARWHLVSLTPFAGFRGTAVIQKKAWEFNYWDGDQIDPTQISR